MNVTLGECDRCGTLCGFDGDGLEMPHVLPCGRECELTAASDVYRTCAGWCHECRRIRTGCVGVRNPCGRDGCGECGIHWTAKHGEAACRRAPALSRRAWTWDNVTCTACLAIGPS